VFSPDLSCKFDNKRGIRTIKVMKKKPGKIIVPKRIDGVIRELPKHNNAIMPSAIAAGYSLDYARTGTKPIRKAMERRIKDLQDNDPENDLLRGVWSKKELIGEYKKVITQDKDYGTKLKAISPLLQESGIIPKPETEERTIPTLILNFALNAGKKEERTLIPSVEESPAERQLEAIEAPIEDSPIESEQG
jgi:hypothetical protein